jgi:hypothetical protein
VFFQNTPFSSSLELATLAVLPPMDGIPHRRHLEDIAILFLFGSLLVSGVKIDGKDYARRSENGSYFGWDR